MNDRAALSSIEMLAKLVAFPTVSRDSNLPLIDFVEDYLSTFGARCRRTVNEDGTKANLYAVIGPDAPGGVVLSGHTDVVPVDGQDWHTDPFQLTEKEGLLYGRGSSDMKGFSAVFLSRLADLDPASLNKPLCLALSYDEEVGCLGIDRMVDDALAHFEKPAYAIIGEPTTMQIVRAHKSINVFRTVVTGQAAHSSQPHRGAGAIFAAARIIEQLRQIGEGKRAAAVDSGCEPPWTTVQVGRIDGGTAVNILPAHCEFLWEYRGLPDEDPEEIITAMQDFIETEVLPDLREFAPEASVETTPIARVPPLMPDPEARAETWVRSLNGVRDGGSGAVSFATEAGSFQRAGISSVVCGPGSIDQAHQPNEFIDPAELERCERMVDDVIAYLSRS
ncbi:acetylornithine deacetylase [Wenzhouxiangella marina]|uniref:Acetylornithine deacetylase n=1 Tax=Wenzhouxiangella marina TaxID=1579979 RepID=A0A0K0XY59_9GAMM|nr:acetylornithine deacetylase [Wenzhouxiangella marina]AKS42561.1 Acetylornithine deacetylase [Wenzhouxiangella marina]MBB6085657.1 acetylornithine deacetylase [Wenzhouxiangella marina]